MSKYYRPTASDYRRLWPQAPESFADASGEIKTLRERLGELEADVAALASVATGALSHRYHGGCPDEVAGFEARDPDCPACQVLIRLADKQTGEPN